MARVLVLEDDEDIAGLIDAILTRDGHLVEVAPDGSVGWEKVLGAPYDVVLVDRVMPGLDGIEVVRACRARPDLRDVPILMLTARALPAEVQQGLDAGVSAYMTKPFLPRELSSLVAGLVVGAGDACQGTSGGAPGRT
ncbi:response regulator [Nocardioides sp.]|uniref:response regulator transcription factor n=1 Tax=Nocardioides sp. TaxID=35761 RepID=UPI00321A3310